MPEPRLSQANYDFGGAVAVVTGGASGIGLEVARRLAASDAAVVVWDIAEPKGGDVPATGIRCDVSDDQAVAAATAETLATVGAPRLLVNCAGVVGVRREVAQTDPAEWDRVFAVDLRGAFLVTRRIIPAMASAGGGRIVNVASMTALDANAGYAAYSAAKAGLLSLTAAVAKECAAAGIRANAVAPGMVATPFIGEMDAEYVTGRRAKSAMGRLIEPWEVAAAVLWLLSEEASFVNGETLALTGGRL